MLHIPKTNKSSQDLSYGHLLRLTKIQQYTKEEKENIYFSNVDYWSSKIHVVYQGNMGLLSTTVKFSKSHDRAVSHYALNLIH